MICQFLRKIKAIIKFFDLILVVVVLNYLNTKKTIRLFNLLTT